MFEVLTGATYKQKAVNAVGINRKCSKHLYVSYVGTVYLSISFQLFLMFSVVLTYTFILNLNRKGRSFGFSFLRLNMLLKAMNNHITLTFTSCKFCLVLVLFLPFFFVILTVL